MLIGGTEEVGNIVNVDRMYSLMLVWIPGLERIGLNWIGLGLDCTNVSPSYRVRYLRYLLRGLPRKAVPTVPIMSPMSPHLYVPSVVVVLSCPIIIPIFANH